MAASVNRVILIGNCGKDPDVRSLQDGAQVVSFTLATSESWNDRSSGERKERTEWNRVVVIGNDHLAKIAAERIHKGSKVYVEGKLQTRKWSAQDGSDRYTTEIVVGRFGASLILLDRPDSGARDDGDSGGAYSAPGTSHNTSHGGSPESGHGTVHRGAAARHNQEFGDGKGRLDDNEIPF